MWKMAMLMAATAAGILLSMTGAGLRLPAALILAAVALRLLLFHVQKSNTALIPTLSHLHLAWIALLFAGIGCLSAILHRPSPNFIDCDSATFQGFHMTARVKARATTEKGERYQAELLSITPEGADAIAMKNIDAMVFADASSVFAPGDIISFRGNLKPLRFSKEGVSSYSVFMKRKWSKESNYHRVGVLETEQPVVIGHKDDIFTLAAKAREGIKIRLEKSSLNENALGLVKAILIAERGGLDAGRTAMFRDAGMSHMLAVSGMHVGIIASILLFLTMPFALFGGRNLRYVVVLAGIWFFAFLSGLSYSTLRASLMFTLAALALMMERNREAFSSVCCAGLLILIFSPTALSDVGFQLSFTCVASVCLFVEKLNPMHHHDHPRLHTLCSTLLTTIVATAATWTLCAYYFKLVPINFLAANIVVLPLLPFYMFLAIGYLLLSLAGFDLAIIADGLNFATDLLYDFIGIFAGTSVGININIHSVYLWMAGLALLAVSLNIIPPKVASGAVISHAATRVSYPWLAAAIAVLLMAIVSIFAL